MAKLLFFLKNKTERINGRNSHHTARSVNRLLHFPIGSFAQGFSELVAVPEVVFVVVPLDGLSPLLGGLRRRAVFPAAAAAAAAAAVVVHDDVVVGSRGRASDRRLAPALERRDWVHAGEEIGGGGKKNGGGVESVETLREGERREREEHSRRK